MLLRGVRSAGLAVIICAGVWFQSATSMGQALELVYDVQRTAPTQGGDRSKQVRDLAAMDAEPRETEKLEWRVVLARDWLSVDRGRDLLVVDYVERRIRSFDRAAKTCRDESLFGGPAFRAFEFQNRQFISGMLDAAGVKSHADLNFELECQFGIRDPSTTAGTVIGKRVERAEISTGTAFLYGEKTVATCAWTTSSIDSKLVRSHRRFLAHMTQLHPDVRANVAAAEKTVSRLTFRTINDNFGRTDVDMQLRSERKLETADRQTTAGFTVTRSSDRELEELLETVQSEGRKWWSNEPSAWAAIEALEKKGEKLDAVLSAMELSLSTGRPYAARMKKLFTDAKSDSNVVLFAGATGVQSKGEAVEAIKALDSISRKGLTKGHVIDIMKANHLSATGDFTGARKLFLKVLKINPGIAGAWKDLGDIYARSYEMSDAWACYDAARMIAPMHSLLREVNQIEQRLMKDQSDYF